MAEVDRSQSRGVSDQVNADEMQDLDDSSRGLTATLPANVPLSVPSAFRWPVTMAGLVRVASPKTASRVVVESPVSPENEPDTAPAGASDTSAGRAPGSECSSS